MAKVILNFGVYQFLMPSKTAALAVLNALLDARELEYEGHDDASNIIYKSKPAPACKIESAAHLVERTVRKPDPVAAVPRPAPAKPSAADLWNKPRTSGNIVPHSDPKKCTSPREDAPQALELRPISRRAAKAQFALLAKSIAPPDPNVICLEDRKPAPAQPQLFLEEDMNTSRRALG